MTTQDTQAATIAALNDHLRTTLTGGRVHITAGIDALPDFTRANIMTAVRAFDAFDTYNDPYGEHDCATLTVDGHEVMFKVDYYDRSLQYGSPAPWDSAQTCRVLTVLLANEY